MTRSFAVTFDYLCPFARNAHEAVVAGIRNDRDWEVRFLPFSLSQAHVEADAPHVWDRPPGAEGTSGVLALTWAVAVREGFPERFLDYHLASFAARHDRSEDINDEEVLGRVAASVGLDPEAVVERVTGGEPLDRLAEEHREATERWRVFGVPTVIQGDEAVFVRLMERGRLDDLEQVLDLVVRPRLNEFKRTTVPG